jgi:uncharacterized Tic20 family protein
VKAAEGKADRLAAALSHAGVMPMMIGGVIPLAFWLSQKDRSELIRFQSMQALVYHVAGVVAYFILTGCYMLSIFIMPLSWMVIPSGDEGLLSLLPLTGIGLFALAFLIGSPLYIAFGYIAAWRVLQGHDFRYPLIGSLTERLLNRSKQAEDTETQTEGEA